MGRGRVIHLIVKTCFDQHELMAWFTDRDTAERWVLDNPPSEYEWLYLYALAEHGVIEEVEAFQHISEKYRGPLVRAKVKTRRNGDGGGYLHRVPIDCSRPHWPHHELTEDHPMWVVANSCCGTDHQHAGEDYWQCHCGEWIEVEGSPERVAEFVAMRELWTG